MKRILLVTILVSVAAALSLGGDVLAIGTVVKYKNADLGITFDMPARWGKVLETSQSPAFYLIATTPMPFTAKFMSADYTDQYHPLTANVFALGSESLDKQCRQPYVLQHSAMPWSSDGVMSWVCAPMVVGAGSVSVQSFVVYEVGSSGADLGYYFRMRAFAPYNGIYFGAPLATGASGGVEFSLDFENIEKKMNRVAPASSGVASSSVAQQSDAVRQMGERYLSSVKKLRGFPMRDASAARSFFALVKSYEVISSAVNLSAVR